MQCTFFIRNNRSQPLQQACAKSLLSQLDHIKKKKKKRKKKKAPAQDHITHKQNGGAKELCDTNPGLLASCHF